MPAKKDQYRLIVINAGPFDWVRRFPGGVYGTRAEAASAANALAGQLSNHLFRLQPRVAVVGPADWPKESLAARSRNLREIVLCTLPPVATDFDDAEPRLRKFAEGFDSRTERFLRRSVPVPAAAGPAPTVRRGALATSAGVRYLYEMVQAREDVDRLGNYRFTAEELVQYNTVTGWYSAAMEAARQALDGLTVAFVTSTIHRDEL